MKTGKELYLERIRRLDAVRGGLCWNPWDGNSVWREPPLKPIPFSELRRLTLEAYNYTCQKCGCTPFKGTGGKMLVVHHIDGNPSNNDPGNLTVLCSSCHARISVE